MLGHQQAQQYGDQMIRQNLINGESVSLVVKHREEATEIDISLKPIETIRFGKSCENSLVEF